MFQAKYMKQRKDETFWLSCGWGLRAPFTSFPHPPFSVVTSRGVQCEFSEHSLQAMASLDCSEIFLTRLLKPGCCQEVHYHLQLSVPGTDTGSCPRAGVIPGNKIPAPCALCLGLLWSWPARLGDRSVMTV